MTKCFESAKSLSVYTNYTSSGENILQGFNCDQFQLFVCENTSGGLAAERKKTAIENRTWIIIMWNRVLTIPYISETLYRVWNLLRLLCIIVNMEFPKFVFYEKWKVQIGSPVAYIVNQKWKKKNQIGGDMQR